MKTFQDFIQSLTEKSLTNAELQDLIDRATDAVRGVLADNTKSRKEKNRAKEVIDWITDVDVSLAQDGKLHPNTVNGLMRIVAGVGSGRFGRVVPGWRKSPDGAVPAQYKS